MSKFLWFKRLSKSVLHEIWWRGPFHFNVKSAKIDHFPSMSNNDFYFCDWKSSFGIGIYQQYVQYFCFQNRKDNFHSIIALFMKKLIYYCLQIQFFLGSIINPQATSVDSGILQKNWNKLFVYIRRQISFNLIKNSFKLINMFKHQTWKKKKKTNCMWLSLNSRSLAWVMNDLSIKLWHELHLRIACFFQQTRIIFLLIRWFFEIPPWYIENRKTYAKCSFESAFWAELLNIIISNNCFFFIENCIK